jgi:hypothetical protein
MTKNTIILHVVLEYASLESLQTVVDLYLRMGSGQPTQQNK